MVDQIIDKKTVYGPGPMGDVTPEAAALLGESKDAVGDARGYATQSANAVGDARGYATQSANALTQLASWLANATSAPQAYATLADLQSDRPQGSGIAVVIADGFLYWWDAAANQWKKGSQYQSVGLTAGQLGVLANALTRDRQISNASQVVAPYDNLDTLPLNSVVTYAIGGGVANMPIGSAGTVLTFTGTNSTSGTVQIFVAPNGVMWHRIAWGQPAKWGSWNNQQYDRIADASLPSLSMFGHIGVIGDSYASGVTCFDNVWGTPVDSVKWPVMLTRKWGISYLDLAKGGLSTRTWLTDDKGLTRLNASDPQDLYLFCLGINDYYNLGLTYLGAPDDIDSGADTFYGNSARILRAIKSKAPDARIIVLGLASTGDQASQFDAALKTIAARFAIPFIEQTSEPFFTSTYYTNNLSGGHPTGPLYGAMALAMERLIQRAVTGNYAYFQRYGYVSA